MNRFVIVVLLIAVGTSISEARVFTRCSLAQELKRLGVPDIANWVCLAEAESSLNTAAWGPPNSDGSRDHGLFQINDRFWCSTSATPGKDCNLTCASLRNDDITNDVACTRIIYRRHGFEAWYGWVSKCKGRDVSGYIAGCGV